VESFVFGALLRQVFSGYGIEDPVVVSPDSVALACQGFGKKGWIAGLPLVIKDAAVITPD
jgi:hypothetical protein